MGLNGRTSVAGGLLALLVALAFAGVLREIDRLRGSEDAAQHSQRVIAQANRLERFVIDIETGQRGFVISGDERFLEPWSEARQRLPAESAELVRLAASRSDAQGGRAQQIAEAVKGYVDGYSVPTVEAARRDPAAVRTGTMIDAGRRLIDDLRGRFFRFAEAEDILAAQRQRQARDAAHRAVVAAGAGVGTSLLLIALFVIYMTRTIVRPVRQMAGMAGRVASGDLTVRVPGRGTAEIGDLERAFNSMGASLEANDRELRRLVDELAASRARVIAAADEARRRIERDLHDGTQQRLVALALDLRAAAAGVPADRPDLQAQLSRTADGLNAALEELRELARGIHPSILARGGLEPALRTLARRSPVPVQLRVALGRRLPDRVEVALYYVVSESLTNVAKHARATRVCVDLEAGGAGARLKVDDDGVGGATPTSGSGLIGLHDRIGALGGTIEISSPEGKGTTLLVDIPVAT